MYPLQCHAGFSMPVKAGKFEIAGFSVAAQDTAIAIQLVLVDDKNVSPTNDTFGKLLTSADGNKNVLVHRKGIVTYGVQIDSFMFSEPIKTRYGLSVRAENVKAGSLCVYVR
jgi:hypothetical protein